MSKLKKMKLMMTGGSARQSHHQNRGKVALPRGFHRNLNFSTPSAFPVIQTTRFGDSCLFKALLYSSHTILYHNLSIIIILGTTLSFGDPRHPKDKAAVLSMSSQRYERVGHPMDPNTRLESASHTKTTR